VPRAATAGQPPSGGRGGPGVDRAERRRGERGEHARVRADALRDALAAGQSGPDEVEGVRSVAARAGGAAGRAAVAAGDQEATGRFVNGVEGVQDFAGRAVHGGAVADELHGAGAAGNAHDLGAHPVEVVEADQLHQVPYRGTGEVLRDGAGCHAEVSSERSVGPPAGDGELAGNRRPGPGLWRSRAGATTHPDGRVGQGLRRRAERVRRGPRAGQRRAGRRVGPG
jgi:hypothetical protein